MLKKIIVGIIIGMASVMPGVSGGTIAVSMGIYDKIIYAFTHIFSEFKKSVKVLFPFVIGIGIGIVGLAFLIEFMFNRAPFQTNLLFIGLILGGLPAVWKKVSTVHMNWKYIVAFLCAFLFILGISLFKGEQGFEVQLDLSMLSYIKLFGVGIIASATLVIPGISGTMILLVIGYYTPLLHCINDFIKAVVTLNMPVIGHSLCILIPFGLGIAIGAYIISKTIEVVFTKHPMIAYWAIIGLIIASPIAIIAVNRCLPSGIFSFITGVATFVVGIMVANILKEDVSSTD
jgi:putative membrane protein